MSFAEPTRGARTSDGPFQSWDDMALTPLWRTVRSHPLTVTFVVFLVYGASLWLSFGVQNQNPRALATIGTKFIQQGGGASSIIQQDLTPIQYTGEYGYDGQFSYFIAMDPLHAAPYIDDPALRYERILYPLTARALALGDPEFIPYTLVYVNALAILAGTLAVALWLRRRRMTPWIALVYGLFPGLFTAFRHDLTEPLGFALLAWGILALGWSRPRLRFVAASILFALAALSRETTLFVSVPYILRLAWPEITEREWVAMRPGALRATAVFMGSVGPFLIWKAVLYGLFGSVLVDAQQYLPLRAPFSGLFAYWLQSADPQILSQVLFVAFPGAIAALAAILALFRWPVGWRPSTISLAINALYMCVFLAPQSYNYYISAGRIQTGIVLAAIFALPIFDRLWRQSRGWFWAANALWLAPLWAIAVFPTIQGYLVYFRVFPA